MTGPWFAFRRQGSSVVHLSRYQPRGYGISALCGYALSDAMVAQEPNRMRPTRDCRRCRKAANSQPDPK